MSALKTSVKRAFRTFGFRINRVPKSTSLAHEDLFPFATWSPWNVDRGFIDAYDQIQNHTLVDKYRCYELWQLTEQAAKLPEGALLEVGVWRGGTGALIARKAQDCGITDNVYLCDTFTGVVKAGEHDHTYSGGEHEDTSREVVEQLAGRMQLMNVEILQGIFPDDTAHHVAEQKFRFCHIDVDVYQSAKEVNQWVWDRLVPGGIVVYDDYGFQACDGVLQCVEEQRQLKDRIVLHNLNGHAVVIKLASSGDLT
ncbi:MAG: TylF/MycF/NovP-related O-methyltransferase [Fuerstiella sp.]